MNLKPVFYKRDFSDRIQPEGLVILPVSFTWSAVGGPKLAIMSARGDRDGLWKLVEMLRCPIELRTDEDQPVWWGYVSEVKVRVKGIEFTISLDKMANNIRAAYNLITNGQIGGDKTYTTWASHANSIAEFGTKQRQLSLSSSTAAAASQAVASELSWSALPQVAWADSQAVDSLSATLTCAGWFSTLDWELYSENAGAEGYSSTGNGVIAVGDNVARTAVYQTFQTASATAWNADSVMLHVRKEGAPGDSLQVQLCNDSAGTPGTVLQTLTIAPGALSSAYSWVTAAFPGSQSIAPATTYGLKISRTGGIDATNYYSLDLSEDLGYSRGFFRVFNGTSWAARSPDADMLFTVFGVMETTLQIANIVTKTGQFLAGTSILNASGVSTSAYRIGDVTGQSEVETLLNFGSSNARRMLCTVNRTRKLELYEAPAIPWIADYKLTSDKVLLNKFDAAIDNVRCPIGVWVQLSNAIPQSVDLTKMTDPSWAFLTEFTYTPATDRVTFKFNNIRSMRDIGRIG